MVGKACCEVNVEPGYWMCAKISPRYRVLLSNRPCPSPLLIVLYWDRLASDRGAGLANEKRKVVQTPVNDSYNVLQSHVVRAGRVYRLEEGTLACSWFHLRLRPCKLWRRRLIEHSRAIIHTAITFRAEFSR